jgi:pectin methylesterase-like acyl-CoA thioesterase
VSNFVHFPRIALIGIVWINQGTYKEQVSINSLNGPLVLYGYTSDTSSYAGNKVTITYNLSQASGVSNDGSATLRAEIGNLKVYNINIVNSYGKGSQAVAVSAQGDKTGFYGVSFKGTNFPIPSTPCMPGHKGQYFVLPQEQQSGAQRLT